MPVLRHPDDRSVGQRHSKAAAQLDSGQKTVDAASLEIAEIAAAAYRHRVHGQRRRLAVARSFTGWRRVGVVSGHLSQVVFLADEARRQTVKNSSVFPVVADFRFVGGQRRHGSGGSGGCEAEHSGRLRLCLCRRVMSVVWNLLRSIATS